MYAKKEKSKESQKRAVTNSAAQKSGDRRQGFGFVDNRAEALVQRKLQKMTDNVQLSPTSATGTKQVINNRVVQCLKGAKGTAQEDKPVPYTLNPEFITKHVANNLAEAISVTEARIETGDPPGLVAGTAPNNLAKESDWRAALDRSDTIVPPEDVWYGGNDSGWVTRLTLVNVNGWKAQKIDGTVTAEVATNKKYLGGQWTVSNSDVDEADTAWNVTMDISHLTS